MSWSLPAHYHLEAMATADAAVRRGAARAADTGAAAQGRVGGDGRVFILKDTGQEGLLEARYRLARFQVRDCGARVHSAGG